MNKMNKKSVVYLLIMLLVFMPLSVFAEIDGDTASDESEVPAVVENVDLQGDTFDSKEDKAVNYPKNKVILQNVGDSYTINVEEEFQLEYLAGDSKCKAITVKWTTSNAKCVSVDSNGLIRGIQKGSATITCYSVKSKKVKDTCKVYVGDKVESITIDEAGKLVKTKSSKTINYTVYPETAANKALKWESSNTKVMTVSNKGVIKTQANGVATITCRSTDGSQVYASYEFKSISKVTDSDVNLIAHRGDVSKAPECTLPAIKEAVKAGYKYIEFDVWESNSSGDDVFFAVMHDSTTKRMCGKKYNIKCSKLNSTNISKYPVTTGTNIKKYGKKLPIPTIEQVLDVIYGANREVIPIIHIHADAGQLTQAGLDRVLELCGDRESVILSSVPENIRYLNKNAGDNIKLWAGVSKADETVLRYSLEAFKRDYEGCKLDGVTMSSSCFNFDISDTLAGEGYDVTVFAVKRIEEYIYFRNRGVTSYFCDGIIF